MKIELQKSSKPGIENKGMRFLWMLVYWIFFRPSPVPAHFFRIQLLRFFGTKVGRRVRIYPGANIWAPWNLRVGNDVTIGKASLYSVTKIEIGDDSIISDGVLLCTATHDYQGDFGLQTASIKIENNVWLATDVFVAPGITVEAGSVALAKSVLVKSVGPYEVWAGNPAAKKKDRKPYAKNTL